MSRSRTNHQISVLSTWHLVIEDTGVRCSDICFKAAVKDSDLGPVQIEGLNVSISDAGSELRLLQRHADSAH